MSKNELDQEWEEPIPPSTVVNKKSWIPSADLGCAAIIFACCLGIATIIMAFGWAMKYANG